MRVQMVVPLRVTPAMPTDEAEGGSDWRVVNICCGAIAAGMDESLHQICLQLSSSGKGWPNRVEDGSGIIKFGQRLQRLNSYAGSFLS